MCQVSNTIKFCSCNDTSIENLEHYWLLYKFVKNKRHFIAGMALMPSSYTDKNYDLNANTIEQILNSNAAFDIEIAFKNKDILEVGINQFENDENKRLHYHFEYKKGVWKANEIIPFDLMNKYKELEFGKVENALIISDLPSGS